MRTCLPAWNKGRLLSQKRLFEPAARLTLDWPSTSPG